MTWSARSRKVARTLAGAREPTASRGTGWMLENALFRPSRAARTRPSQHFTLAPLSSFFPHNLVALSALQQVMQGHGAAVVVNVVAALGCWHAVRVSDAEGISMDSGLMKDVADPRQATKWEAGHQGPF